MDWILPMILIADKSKTDRSALMEQILPAAIPGPSSQRLALAVIGAKRQLERQARSEQQLLKEAVLAAQFDQPDQLDNFPGLQAAFRRLPLADQAAIFPAANE